MINYYGNEITWVPVLAKENKPIYILLAESIENDIKSGRLKSGFKLPAQRLIANYLGINHSTVTRAYKLCEEKGLIKGVTGKGTFVSSTAGIPNDLLTTHNENKIIELGMGLPLYEVNDLIRASLNEFNSLIDDNVVLKYSLPEGNIKHRYIASQWLKQYKVDCDPQNIIITAGSQNALSVVLISMFSKGDRIIVDEYTYTGFKSLANLLGIIMIPVKADSAGIIIDELKKVCKREKVKGIYLIPDCHNPTTITISKEKRYEISKVVKQYNLILIEDATYSFSINNKLEPLKSIIPKNTIYIQGTSKALNATFRVAYLVAPKRYVSHLKHTMNNITWMASPLTSELVSLFQSTQKYDEIVAKKISILSQRNKIADQLLAGYELVPSTTTLFRYLILPQGIDDIDLERICLESGVQVFSSKRFLIGSNNDNNAIRISVSGANDTAELVKGINILRDAVENYGLGGRLII